jgi:crotonobetainyl-CoA:carnitine CoA-transferase CaiB-like acyl-CoA transferase
VNLALEGIKVLSLAEQYPGPYATLIVADLGADVILVERPSGGDPSRQFPAFFEALNRNKRSVALDLKSEEGKIAFLRIARDADVLLEGFRPGVMGQLGLGYEEVAAVNPGIVYASISGFGQDSPYRNRPAHDLSYQAAAGMLHEQVEVGEPGPAPKLCVGDLSSGMFAIVGVLTGLLTRQRTGRGTYVDVSMADGLVSWMTAQLVPAINCTGAPWFPKDPAYGVFRTADGSLLSLSVAHEDHFWRRLCGIVGMENVADLTSKERNERYEELAGRLAKGIAEKDRSELEEVLVKAGVPFGPVLGLEEVSQDEHVRARGLIVEVPEGDGRPSRKHVRQPLKLGGFEDGAPRRHSPRLGEHTREVLLAAGFADDEVNRLVAEGAALDGRVPMEEGAGSP